MADYIDAFRDTGTPTNLSECTSCGRTFNPTVLHRHEKICQGAKKRKPFDSSKQRNLDLPKDFKKSPAKTRSEFTPQTKKSNWREKHEEFISNIRLARNVTVAQKTGAPLPPPPPASINPDYVQCPHCSRRFNEHAAERHIPFCKEQTSRIAKPSSARTSNAAKRTQYKPPLPGKKASGGSATPVSSAGKTRQMSSKTTSVLTSPTQNSGSPPVRGVSRQPIASPNARRKQTSNSSPVSAHKTQSSPSQQRNKDLNGNTGRTGSREKLAHLYDSDEEIPAAQTRGPKYGRRSSPANDNTEHTGARVGSGSRYARPGSDYSDISDRISSSSSSGRKNRHGAIRDPSPTLFDDFGLDNQSPPPPNDHAPFPFKGRLHKTSSQSEVGRHRDGMSGRKLSKFCHECGTRYPVDNAKFCCECGMKRLFIDI